MNTAPTSEQRRIESLDVVRGFALLGILLLNILGFALPSHLYLMPLDVVASSIDFATWVFIELTSEGAMRCLFSILFGAGVALFLDPAGGRSGRLHYKRTFWLMIFGLFDAVVLLWMGDILFVYALAGFILYWVRNVRASRLLVSALLLLLLISLQYAVFKLGVVAGEAAEVQLATLPEDQHTPELLGQAAFWREMQMSNDPPPERVAEELQARNDSYLSAFKWNASMYAGQLFFVIPVILLWDALAMMLLGMALYKYGVLQGDRAASFYRRMMFAGFAVGLTVNAYETYTTVASDFALAETFPQMQWSYHIGRLAMAMSYLSLLVLLVKYDLLTALRRRLAAVGRMALTNYLSHSLVCLVLFTGAGFGLAGYFSRFEIYGFVLAIWLFQLWFSPWWLSRYRFGPVEWLWRALTYGQTTPNRRTRDPA